MGARGRCGVICVFGLGGVVNGSSLLVDCGRGDAGNAYVIVVEAFDGDAEGGGHCGVGIGIDDCDFDGAGGRRHNEMFLVGEGSSVLGVGRWN